uniref:Uncharacterized protein n=1 Tax=Stegastes partitus TaxID=144197 RepID=A0A3B5ACY4_9TELE
MKGEGNKSLTLTTSLRFLTGIPSSWSRLARCPSWPSFNTLFLPPAAGSGSSSQQISQSWS